ncbi:MAG: OmpA family protein, partial [Mucilaginibacter sp.]
MSFASLMVVGIVNAQTDSTKTATATTTSTETTTPKVFGGAGQYNKFSIGVNVGATSPSVATGGSNDFTHNKVQLGYGISFREQLAHSFGLQLDLHGGKVEGDNTKYPGTEAGYTAQ